MLDFSSLGEPSLRIAGLRVWVHGRQFPASQDYWDGNWLRITALCKYAESSVQADGPLVHAAEVWGLLQSSRRLYETLAGSAKLKCIEPNLSVELLAGATGHIDVAISITPDQMTEEHRYRDTIDQSYLPAIISECEAILATFPIREPSNLPARGDA